MTRSCRARGASWLFTLAALVFSGACKKDPLLLAARDAGSTDDSVVTATIAAPPLDAGPPEAPPRCTATETKLVLGAPAAGGVAAGAADVSDLELGEGTVTKRGFAIGVARQTAGGRVAAVALASPDLVQATLVDLGLALADAPPPRPVARGDELYAAYHPRVTDADAGAARVLDVVLVRATGEAPTRLARLAQPRDESFAFDVAFTSASSPGVVVWDDDATDGARGVVRALPIAGGDDAGAAGAIALSTKGTDAEMPRLARRPGGYFAVWIVRRPESVRDGGAPKRKELEGPAEERDVRWLEGVALDEAGRPLGAPRVLTPLGGHVASFDVTPRGDGAVLEIVARDETEVRDGAGGRILKAALRVDGVEAATTLLDHGAGRAAADVLVSPDALPWLTLVDTAEHTRVLPLTPTLVPAPPTAAASVEPALEGARPMFVARRGVLAISAVNPPPDAVAILAVGSAAGRATLRVALCAR